MAPLRAAKVISFILIGLLFLFLFIDLSYPPQHQLTVKVMVFSIEQYCKYISSHLKGFVTCKFTPNCSHYAILALEKHGVLKGTVMIIIRLAKCSPLSSAHGEDYP